MSYLVTWENQIDNAGNPLDAAMQCRADIANGETTMFIVIDLSNNKKYSVNLGETEGDETLEIKQE